MAETLSNKTFNFELITPSEVLLNTEVNQISVVSAGGEIGILANHTDFVTKLEIAPVRYFEGNEEKFVAVLGGILEIKGDKVTIISDFAEKEEDINEAKAHQAKKIAEAELSKVKTSGTDERDLLIAELRLQKELLRLQTLQRSRSPFN